MFDRNERSPVSSVAAVADVATLSFCNGGIFERVLGLPDESSLRTAFTDGPLLSFGRSLYEWVIVVVEGGAD